MTPAAIHAFCGSMETTISEIDSLIANNLSTIISRQSDLGRRCLSLKKRDAEIEESMKVQTDMASKVILNVGGILQKTYRSTLTKVKESRLEAMFSGRYDLQSCEDGSYFIDRDGLLFSHILNYLRDDHIELPKDPIELQMLQLEFQYFNIPFDANSKKGFQSFHFMTKTFLSIIKFFHRKRTI